MVVFIISFEKLIKGVVLFGIVVVDKSGLLTCITVELIGILALWVDTTDEVEECICVDKI